MRGHAQDTTWITIDKHMVHEYVGLATHTIDTTDIIGTLIVGTPMTIVGDDVVSDVAAVSDVARLICIVLLARFVPFGQLRLIIHVKRDKELRQ